MKDFKRLLKRDRLYWLVMAGVMLWVTIKILVEEYGFDHRLFDLSSFLEISEYSYSLQEKYPELFEPRDVFYWEIPDFVLESLIFEITQVVLFAQAIKIVLQENKNRTEVLRTFPVKSHSLLTYQYLSGVILTCIPNLIAMTIILADTCYVEKNTNFIFINKWETCIFPAKALILFLMHYSLLILCRKVTNHIPGTVFTLVVAELGVWLASINMDLFNVMEATVSIGGWVCMAILAVAFLVLSYIADWKKDDAKNGVYAFTIVHWFMMVVIFIEVNWMFDGIYENLPKAVVRLMAILVALFVTGGVHYIVKPKKM